MPNSVFDPTRLSPGLLSDLLEEMLEEEAAKLGRRERIKPRAWNHQAPRERLYLSLPTELFPAKRFDEPHGRKGLLTQLGEVFASQADHFFLWGQGSTPTLHHEPTNHPS